MNEHLIETLKEIGYDLKNHNGHYRSKSLYRNGSNPTSLVIYSDKNLVIDWVTQEKFSIQKLIQRTLNLNDENFQVWLKNKNIEYTPLEKPKPKIEVPKFFDKKILNELLPIHDYWLNRKISLETLKKFGGGLCPANRPGFLMKDRYCFPIFNSKNEIIGITGRDITNNKKSKWKHLSEKSKWVYPAFLNKEVIKEKKEVILVESVGDLLSLYECGIKNVLCLFGVDLGLGVLNFLLRISPRKIIISTNNEESRRGNDAAIKIYNKLTRYFNKNQLEIKLPKHKDFNEWLVKEGKIELK